MTALWEQATSLQALLHAADRAARGKRHQPEVARFLMDRERLCLRLGDALRAGTWRPGAPRTFPLFDPKPRTITVLPFPDRVVHHALCAVAEPFFERAAIFDSYACRAGKGQHAALRRARRFAAAAPWAWKGDVAACFASIPHDPLLALLRRRLPDEPLCACLERIVRAAPAAAGRGLPIGSLTSQHLANLYLGALDHFIKDDLGVRRYLRYMDDLVLFGERPDLLRWREAVVAFLADRLGLAPSTRGCHLLPVRDGVPFLGWRVYPALLRLRPGRLQRFRRRQRTIEAALAAGALTEEQAAASLASQFAHIAQASTYQLRRQDLVRVREGPIMGAGRSRPQAREPGRLLQEHRPERPGGEPQQVAPRQREQRPGLSCGERSTRIPIGESRPEGPGPRTRPPCPGADQARVQRLAGGLIPGGTEAPRPGGGLLRGVAAGPFFPALLRGDG